MGGLPTRASVVARVECGGREGMRAREDEGPGILRRKITLELSPEVTSMTFLSAFLSSDAVKGVGHACLSVLPLPWAEASNARRLEFLRPGFLQVVNDPDSGTRQIRGRREATPISHGSVGRNSWLRSALPWKGQTWVQRRLQPPWKLAEKLPRAS